MKAQRRPESPYIKSVRPMVKADVEALRLPSDPAVRIKKLGAVHLQMVRLFALGMSNTEVASTLGYSQTRVSVIRNSPAFQERLSRFMDKADESVQTEIDFTNKLMAQGRIKTLCMIHDRLDEAANDPERPVKDDFILKAFDSFSDRTNYHRKSTKENINIDFAARLEAAITKTRELKVIEHED